MHDPLHSRFAPPPKSIIHGQMLDNMFISPNSARIMHQYKTPCPNNFRHKHKDLVIILLTTWKISRKRFMLRKVASLLGLVPNISLTTQWVKCACVARQRAIHIALKFNSNIFSNGKHKHLTDILQSTHTNIRNFSYQNPTKKCGTQRKSLTSTNPCGQR